MGFFLHTLAKTNARLARTVAYVIFFQSVCSGQKFVASVLHEVHLKKGRSARSYYKVVNEVELRRRFLPEIRAMVVSV